MRESEKRELVPAGFTTCAFHLSQRSRDSFKLIPPESPAAFCLGSVERLVGADQQQCLVWIGNLEKGK